MQPLEDAMNFKLLATALAATVGVASVTIVPADAATKRKTTVVTSSGQVVYGRSNSPNVSYMAGPRTRVFVTKRSWLDAGTEVLPGERHFLDYVTPPGHVSGQTMTGPSAPSGWQNPWYPALGPFEAPYSRNW